jgi:hypothetical protein
VGNEYEVRIRNDTSGDLLAVVSVDGVNAVSGETAATSQSGYALGPRQWVRILGWRMSLERVAAFYFSDWSSAYAVRTGRPHDLGVIGVALFRRKAHPPAQLELEEPRGHGNAPGENGLLRQMPRDAPEQREAPSSLEIGNADASPNSAARAYSPAAVEQAIGTGHGRNQTSYARYVSFERESDSPNELVVLRYDTRANLVARGVICCPPRDSNPFPVHFVPDPPLR